MAALAALLLLLPQDSMGELLRRLRDDDPDARDAAAAALLSRWQDWSEADLDTLRAAAAGKDVELAARARDSALRIRIRRRLGAAALEELKGVDGDLVRGSSAQRVVTLKAVATFAELGRIPESALAGLVQLAAEQRWNLPAQDVLALALTSPRPFAPLVAPAVADPDPRIAKAAIELLDRSGAVEHYGVLVARLGDPALGPAAADVLGQAAARAHAPAVAALATPMAARVLGRMGAIDHARGVADLLGGGDADTLRIAVEALGRMSASGHAEAAAGLLGHEDAFVRAEAATALGRMRAEAPRLVPLLRDRESRVQFAAAEALAQIGDASVVPAVAALLRERDTSHLGFSAQVLGRLNARERAGEVAALLLHNQPWTRSQAARALARLGSLPHLGALTGLVDDEWDLVRTTAAIALAEMADLEWPKDRRAAAAKALRAAAVKDSTAETRIAAAAAALRLEGADADLERRLLQDVDADAADAPAALVEVLALLHEREGWAKLDREIEMDAPVDSPELLKAAARKAGLALAAEEFRLLGRVPAGRTTLRRLLAHFCEGAIPHVEGSRVRPLSLPEALAAWRAYPRKR